MDIDRRSLLDFRHNHVFVGLMGDAFAPGTVDYYRYPRIASNDCAIGRPWDATKRRFLLVDGAVTMLDLLHQGVVGGDFGRRAVINDTHRKAKFRIDLLHFVHQFLDPRHNRWV